MVTCEKGPAGTCAQLGRGDRRSLLPLQLSPLPLQQPHLTWALLSIALSYAGLVIGTEARAQTGSKTQQHAGRLTPSPEQAVLDRLLLVCGYLLCADV